MPPQTGLNEALSQLYQHSQACLQALEANNWPAALEAMAYRQPWLNQLEAACPLPNSLRALPLFTQWQQVERQLQRMMSELNTRQVELQQVFAQIHSARQQLQAYQIDKPGDGSTHSFEG